MIYNRIGCGGTFDHLHAGHKAFLRFAFSHGEKVLIGLTSDAYVTGYKKGNSAPYQIRFRNLEEFLHTEGFGGRYEIMPIDTVFGPAADSKIYLDALVTTEETKQGAEEINAKRKSLGLSELPVITMPMVEKNGARISSTRIRKGEIDTEGNPYIEESFLKDLLLLPEDLRHVLKVPFGKLYSDGSKIAREINASTSIVVGDATAVAFHHKNIQPRIAIVDFVVQRKKTYMSITEEGFSGTEKQLSVLNPSGTITPALWKAIKEAVDHIAETQYVITIEGEEDLAVLPLILLLPLGFVVYYGQPNEGIVQVIINSKTKEHAKSLLRQFKRA